MALLIKAVLGALAKTKNDYIAGLIPLFPAWSRFH